MRWWLALGLSLMAPMWPSSGRAQPRRFCLEGSLATDALLDAMRVELGPSVTRCEPPIAETTYVIASKPKAR